MITPLQKKAIDNIRKLAEDLHTGRNADKYEIKTFEVEENKYSVSVYVVVGLKEDEGTLAEVFCRDTALLFIGPRGGIRYPVSKQMKDGSWKHYYKTFKGYSLLQAVVDQRI